MEALTMNVKDFTIDVERTETDSAYRKEVYIGAELLGVQSVAIRAAMYVKILIMMTFLMDQIIVF